MRLILISGIMGLTALLFYAAVQLTVPGGQIEQARLAQEAQVAELNAQILDRREERQVIDTELARVTAVATGIPALEAEVGALSETNATLLADLQNLKDNEVVNNDMVAEKVALSQELAIVRAQLATLRDTASESATLTDQSAALSQEIVALQSELSAMQQDAAEAETTVMELNKTIAMFQDENQTLAANISALQLSIGDDPGQDSNAVAALETEIAALQEAANEKAAALVLADENIDALTQEVASLVRVENALVESDAIIAGLRADIAVRNFAITELNAQTSNLVNASLVSCQDRSNAALVDGGITFQAATTALAPDAIARLENIAAIAVECAQDDLVLEIEGHTDSEGGIASNLLLSNGRAKSVYDVLVGYGVDPTSMRFVGFGKSDPIADNATADGRAKNGRIVFDWEQS